MPKKRAAHLKKGQQSELQAASFLRAQGVDIVAKNIRSPYGEIDLIGQFNDVLIFVEVRSRRARALVSAAESITAQKQEKLRKTALFYLQNHYETLPNCRFDAICIDGEQVQWLKNIF